MVLFQYGDWCIIQHDEYLRSELSPVKTLFARWPCYCGNFHKSVKLVCLRCPFPPHSVNGLVVGEIHLLHMNAKEMSISIPQLATTYVGVLLVGTTASKWRWKPCWSTPPPPRSSDLVATVLSCVGGVQHHAHRKLLTNDLFCLSLLLTVNIASFDRKGISPVT